MATSRSGMPRVLNRKTSGIPPGAVYVGRGSKWGNPYKIKDGYTREEVIRNYELSIVPVFDMDVLIDELRGKDLVCWCAPKGCHADILLRLANEDVEGD